MLPLPATRRRFLSVGFALRELRQGTATRGLRRPGREGGERGAAAADAAADAAAHSVAAATVAVCCTAGKDAAADSAAAAVPRTGSPARRGRKLLPSLSTFLPPPCSPDRRLGASPASLSPL